MTTFITIFGTVLLDFDKGKVHLKVKVLGSWLASGYETHNDTLVNWPPEGPGYASFK